MRVACNTKNYIAMYCAKSGLGHINCYTTSLLRVATY